MPRDVLRLILDVVLTVALAILLLGGWQSFLSGSVAAGFGEGIRVLFNFMDVGLGIWLVLLIVFTLRSRSRSGSQRGVSAGRTYLFLLLGSILNLIVVTLVGFLQGGWAPMLVLFAIEAGIACLIAAAIVVPIVHRALRDLA